MRSLVDIGIHSFVAYQYAMSVTGQNISMAEVESYSRRDVQFSEAFYSLYGNGVSIAETRRMFDDAASRNARVSTTAEAKTDIMLQNLKDFEFLFDNTSYSISNYLNESLTALNVINANPASAQSRELYLYQLDNIVSRFNIINDNISVQQEGVNKSIQADIASINNITSRLASLNGVFPMSSGEDRDNFLDQRDELLSSLAKFLPFESNVDDEGVLTVELSNGTPLVLGTSSYKLNTVAASDDPAKLDIFLSNNNVLINVGRLINSGEIGGLMNYQNTVLDESKNSLGRLALVISQKFNDQNALGMDLNGVLGANIFTDINKPEAMRQRVINNTGNVGSANMQIHIDDASQLTESDYELVFDSATHYQVIRKLDHTVVGDDTIAGFPASISLEGFTLEIDSGAFVAGDKYILSPTRYAARDMGLEIQDARKLALAAPIATSGAETNTGTGSIGLTVVTDTGNSAFINSGYLNPPIRVEFVSPTSYRLINADDNSLLEDNLVYDPLSGVEVFPTPGGIDPGYRINLSGEIRAGDEFNITYNSNGAGDNRNGLLLAKMYQEGSVENNTLTFSQAFQILSNDVSSKTKAADLLATSNALIKQGADKRKDMVSGVSKVEEYNNLLRFQQSMEASAQIIDAGQKIFETIIGLVRR